MSSSSAATAVRGVGNGGGAAKARPLPVKTEIGGKGKEISGSGDGKKVWIDRTVVQKSTTLAVKTQSEEIFSPVARIDTVRLIIALAAQKQWKIHQMDVKSAILNCPLDEEVYVKQPPGFIQSGKEEMVYRLNKALYGLKQAPRAWNKRIDSFLHATGFKKCPSDHGLYVKSNDSGDLLILCLYVDDVIFTGNNLKMISDFKNTMKKEFEMTDLGLMSYFLGIEVIQGYDGIFIHQRKYAAEFLKKFKMEDSNAVKTLIETGIKLTKDGDERIVDATYFKQIVGSLRYLTCTRPDICYAVGLVSRYMESPRHIHLQAAKRIMRYIKGTATLGLFYSSFKKIEIVGYSDSDWVEIRMKGRVQVVIASCLERQLAHGHRRNSQLLHYPLVKLNT